MTIYKAHLALATEEMYLNPKTKEYDGYDPDTYQDCGIVQSFSSETLEGLISQITRSHDLKDFEEFEGRLEAQVEGEHDYRTPVEERVPFQELWTLVIERCECEHLDAAELLKA